MRNTHKIIFSLILLCLLGTGGAADGFAEDAKTEVYYLEPVVVYPSLIDEYCANSLRSITYFNNPQSAEDQSFSGVLDNACGLDIAQRGVLDIQSDLQIRGASFEQTDVLINGIKINDPQTGHFSLDIPFFMNDFEKVIIINGPAAAVNAASRPGGAISFITKKPKAEEIKASSVFGGNDYSNQMLTIAYPTGNVFSQTSAGVTSSSGYRYNTDFRILKISHASFLENSMGDVEFIFGFMDKEFGANGFYSEYYPDQKEFTKTIITSLGLKSDSGGAYFNPQLYLRRHEDRFLLDGSNPGFYENLHTNRVLGAKLDIVNDLAGGKVFSGADIASESISSSSLGDRQRQRNTLYSVYSKDLEKWTFSGGGTGYFYDTFTDVFVPELSAGYKMNNKFKLRASISQSFRAPTFTELYYNSPANRGNPGLDPEESNNYELGADYADFGFSSQVTIFRRKGKNLIDWVRDPSQTVYDIKNVSKVTTDGLDAGLKIYSEALKGINTSLKEISLNYSYIKRSKQESGLISKYVFDYLKHKAALGGEFILLNSISSRLEMQYLRRFDEAGDFIVNTSFSKKIKSYKLFINIDNLFNHGYSRKANIPMPGRWIFTGIEAKW